MTKFEESVLEFEGFKTVSSAGFGFKIHFCMRTLEFAFLVAFGFGKAIKNRNPNAPGNQNLNDDDQKPTSK